MNDALATNVSCRPAGELSPECMGISKKCRAVPATSRPRVEELGGERFLMHATKSFQVFS